MLFIIKRSAIIEKEKKKTTSINFTYYWKSFIAEILSYITIKLMGIASLSIGIEQKQLLRIELELITVCKLLPLNNFIEHL